MAVGRFFFSASPTAQNSPELHFRFINSFIQLSLLRSLSLSNVEPRNLPRPPRPVARRIWSFHSEINWPLAKLGAFTIFLHCSALHQVLYILQKWKITTIHFEVTPKTSTANFLNAKACGKIFKAINCK